MKEFMKNKKALAVISVVVIIIAAVIAVVAVKNKNDAKVPETSGKFYVETLGDLEGYVTKETEKEAEKATEKTTSEKSTDKTSENVEKTSTTKVEEPTTEVKVPTTTKKAEQVTQKKTETTTKKSTESTTKKKTVTTTNAMSEDEINRLLIYMDYGGEAAYKALIAKEAAFKCEYCGKHNCPSITYKKNELGDVICHSTTLSKCPKASTAKCPHCGRTLVDGDDPRINKEGYCAGACWLVIE